MNARLGSGAEWWRGAVIYQIYPRSFQDSGIGAKGVGDLPGITRRLEHVASLGVEGIWLSPFFRSPMKDFGYDVEDHRAVDPMFGTLEDFDRLLARAHALGLKVVIDMVLNHTSDRHAWFRESRSSPDNPKADWYVWADAKPDGTPPNNWLSNFGGPAWTWDARRRQYYLHNFLASQPDLNLHNVEVQDAVLAECAFWLERGVDGFRLDVANHYLHDPALTDNPPRPPDAPWPDGTPRGNPYGMQIHRHDKSQPENLAFLRRLRALMDRRQDRMAVAEVHDDDSAARAAQYVAEPDLLHTAYNFKLLGPRFGAGVVRSAVEAFEEAAGQGWPSWAFSNHDVTRVATRWGGPDAPPEAAKLLIALLMPARHGLPLPGGGAGFAGGRRAAGADAGPLWDRHVAGEGGARRMPHADAVGGRRAQRRVFRRRALAARAGRAPRAGGGPAGGRSGQRAGLHPPVARVAQAPSGAAAGLHPVPGRAGAGADVRAAVGRGNHDLPRQPRAGTGRGKGPGRAGRRGGPRPAGRRFERRGATSRLGRGDCDARSRLGALE